MPTLYSDLDISFTANTATKDVERLVDADAVKQSVKNLVRTSFYERPFQPSIGGGASKLLFEPLDDITKNLLANEIRLVVETFEPRAKVRLVEFREYTNREPHLLEIDVQFEVLNLPNLVTTTVVVRRLR